MSLTWRVVDPCPSISPDGYMCTGERGHLPFASEWFEAAGQHYASEWKNGEIVGPIAWDDESATREFP